MPAKKKVAETLKDTAKAVRAGAEKAAEEVKDAVTATEIEVKKTVRSTGRKAKEKVDSAKAEAAETKAAVKAETKKAVKKTTRKVKEAVQDKAAQTAEKVETGVKKTARKAKETKDSVVAAVKKPVRKAKAAKTSIVIQSPMGGSITPEEILEKIGEADSVYIRVDQNKAYWVRGEESGSVDLW